MGGSGRAQGQEERKFAAAGGKKTGRAALARGEGSSRQRSRPAAGFCPHRPGGLRQGSRGGAREQRKIEGMQEAAPQVRAGWVGCGGGGAGMLQPGQGVAPAGGGSTHRTRSTHLHALAVRSHTSGSTHQHPPARVGGEVPHPDVAVLVAGDELALVRVQHHRVHGGAALILSLAPRRPQVPDFHCRAGRGQGSWVRGARRSHIFTEAGRRAGGGGEGSMASMAPVAGPVAVPTRTKSPCHRESSTQ